MKFAHNFIKDMKVSFKTFYIYIEILMALIFVAILLFVVPENFSSDINMYAHIDSSLQSNEIVEALESDNSSNIILLDSMDEIKYMLEEDRNSIGISISMVDQKILYNVILQGYESQKYRNIIEKSLIAEGIKDLPEYGSNTNIVTLASSSERLSDRLNMLPIFLLLNSAFTGLFIVATYIFMDKEEGTIRAFAVTPAKVWEYLLSKMGVMLVTGLLTGLITTLLVAGLKANYLHLIALLIATNLFGTSIGLFISSFYDSIMKAMGAILVTFMTLAFATTSYFMPSFNPIIIRILPSYPMAFAFREVFLENPDIAYIYSNVAGFTVLAALFFLWSNHRFKKTLTV
ncbi:ABC transporter permease subunit [Alkalibaculum sp. M08DMB]|uniref:ABC transporter permease subunit n=1 Tax=Alkalibaculum sporogenes TaxID=2655001 RepID=A0A6A7K9F3_9FIRM|nr:ABC transporter permease [Alkalibaculum sporogenes]MPW26108.1 ABC transporter permease subunit [Alkalibaculum sporogenes]